MYRTLAGIPHAVSRWRLTGKLVVESPLHIGDGNWEPLKPRDSDRGALDKNRTGATAMPDYATVAIGEGSRPVVPATAIKGALRAWAVAADLDKALVEEIFGTMAAGGAVTFHDAPWAEGPEVEDPKAGFWSASRRTCVSTHVELDPATRTAKDSHLYYVEYVPAGAVFELRITGQNVSDRARGLLLYVLEHAFRDQVRPARLGSEGASGWGKVRWDGDSTRVGVFDPAAWLRDPNPKPWHRSLRELTDPERRKWLAPAGGVDEVSKVRRLDLHLTLAFEGPMLVNDPTRAMRGDAQGAGAVSHAMIRRADGKAYLPAQSVRGAFRARVRQIWQTLAWEHPERDARRDRNLAQRQGDEVKLGAFFRMVGATGWRSPFEVGDFECAAPLERKQEFVAIDRFTGGVAGSKKFAAEGLLRPMFEGRISLRLDRWEAAGVGLWGWMLLAFALRDWMEGDGCVGFGRSKGYGAFRAKCEIRGTGPEADLLRGFLERRESALDSPMLAEWWRALQALVERKAA